jgi:hypothetical protein
MRDMSPFGMESTVNEGGEGSEASCAGGIGAEEPAGVVPPDPGRPLRPCRVCGAALPAGRRKVHVGRCLTEWKTRMRKAPRKRKG